MPDLNGLRVFCVVARERSYTRAAASAALPLATVSRKVAALERELGVQLLRRTTRRVTLSAAGQLLLERCGPLFEQLDNELDCVGDEQREARGRLRVTLPADLARYWLAAAIARYSARHPAIRLELDLTARVADVAAEGYDLAIRVGEPADSVLRSRLLGRLQHQLYASPGYLAGLPALETPEQLAQVNALTLPGRLLDREWLLTHRRREARITPHGNLAINDVGALLEVAAAGGGVALLPEEFLGPALAAGRLVRVLPQWSGPSVAVVALFPDRHVPLRLRLLLDQLVGAMAPAAGAAP